MTPTAPPRPPRPLKVRADQLVHERGLAETRTKARALILAGEVVAAGGGAGERRVDKPGEQLRDDVELRLKGEGLRYVSRGGLKLEKALEAFRLDVAGLVAMDLGASTGGFTDCLLQRGAARVVAVDVGYGQLHEKLRQDPRVTSHERLNARELPEALGAFDVLVADLSFISLRVVLPSAVARVRPGGLLVLLVKPQFECGREWIEKGGVVRDPQARRRAVSGVTGQLRELGCDILGDVESPITGPAGNVEFLVAARRRVG
jgi:23S rRNA (cytidine1920-2'-O)/16S rRNA (cytidine1409-2'-O)-methyltransferase